tara:strand:- start:210 stop:500 length:291 start_codon:yes stop_codon:yes gene_type:complete
MFKKNNRQVHLGDQFVELGKTNLIWEVVGIIDNPHLPLHARIKKIGEEGVHLTSVSALLDNALFEHIKQKFTEQLPNEQDLVGAQELQNDSYDRTG